ncbi:hypothetical protein ACHAXA_008762 [Cyclostephanos tholiformis]|uniref:Uncharacterized protein n=1 Tax=Cyclostephanos tholiformis TaxID=382380 RepID=A0ABD3RD14_9STRA
MQSTFHSMGGKPTVLQPDVDVVLSLKNSLYKSVMFDCFVRLGGKNTNHNNDAEKETAREALRVFKARSRSGDGRAVRFFKPESRYASRSFVEVDEAAALEKITADIYRRMESAKRWLKSDGTDDDSISENHRPKKTRPPPQAPLETSTKKRKVLKRTPESLPFLSNVNQDIADIIAGEELRAKRKSLDGPTSNRKDQCSDWQPNEVVNFFRGLYVHGWDDWKKVSTMVKTRDYQGVKLYAIKLDRRFPELRIFFSKQGDAVQKAMRARSSDVEVSGSMSGDQNNMVDNRSDPAIIAASANGSMKYQPKMSTRPKVVICLGNYIIDTVAEPSSLRPSIDRKRHTETLPDTFDPSIRPAIPTNNQQIYIPGNNVYARWMNKDDPGSYGTVESYERNSTGVPSLLYHVKFDDGAESIDLDTEDIMMQDQYQAWLKDLENYYSLHVPKDISSTRLAKNSRVYAKWIDPSDPELNGCWMSGKIHSSKTWEGDGNQLRYSYHVVFDNGDQDENLEDGEVLPKEVYTTLLREKMEKERIKPRLCGFDLIAEASKLSSPIKPVKAIPKEHDDELAIEPAARKARTKGSDASIEGSLVDELRCNDVHELRIPSPSQVGRISSTPSPDAHHNIFIKSEAADENTSIDATKAVSDLNAVEVNDVKSALPTTDSPNEHNVEGSNL